ncbi:serine/threonine-protein kinase polo-like [Planococcus citri]|uniref:serine/threonine-protein kinase polo-like n=1 Tax=Planococcus citri TaxID=170843 RepID=UPI0031F8732D
MAHNQADDVVIPEVIIDTSTNSKYARGKFYGKEGFAKCYAIKDMATGRKYAGKIVSKKLLMSNHKVKIAREMIIHKSVNHKHIVGIHGFFEDDEFFYVVLELCRRRSLMELHKRRKALTEPETRYYMKQVLDGVLYLHDNGIIHRDLKLSNLFLNDDMDVKIGCFGLATKIEYENINFMARETINKMGPGFAVDIWSLGCIMYTLLVGKPPFETNSVVETYERIKRCDYKIPTQIKAPAANLITSMLLPDPEKRPTVRKIISSDFFNGYIPSKLPLSCLTVAPRLQSMDVEEHVSLGRRPLAEVNNGGKNSPAYYNDHLRTLHSQLQKVLTNKPSRLQSDAEEITDPAAQPFIWISDWADRTESFGHFCYRLCDSGVGIMFDDESRIVQLANQKNVHYIERDGTENYYTMDNTPLYLKEKMKFLSDFRKHTKEQFTKAGLSPAFVRVQESDSLSRVPYLHRWHRTTSTVIMQLTNGTVQMNFNDRHTSIIMCPLMAAVTYIDTEKNFHTYRFSTIMKNVCNPALLSCLDYAASKIENLLRSQ